MSKAQAALEDLFGLERGLRSSILADQEKAINKIPEFVSDLLDQGLFEVAESTLQRLLDYFKTLPNERRFEFMVLMEEKCKENFMNVHNGGEEFVRRLVPLWESSDSLLKSFVLRWFVLLQNAVVDLPEVRYRIRQSLLAPSSREEFMAAVSCLEVFSSRSFPPVLLDPLLTLRDTLPVESQTFRRLSNLMKCTRFSPNELLLLYHCKLSEEKKALLSETFENINEALIGSRNKACMM